MNASRRKKWPLLSDHDLDLARELMDETQDCEGDPVTETDLEIRWAFEGLVGYRPLKGTEQRARFAPVPKNDGRQPMHPYRAVGVD